MPTPPPPFAPRLGRPQRGHAFALEDSWVWCGSMARDAAGRWHLFASRWPRELPFFDGYKVASQIVRAEAPAPTGPWEFREVVLGDRGARFWDGRMTHNPSVLRAGGRWWLFYIGSTYAGPRPSAAQLRAGWPEILATYRRIRIGVAVADRPQGPWTRPDTPCFDSRPGHWDDGVVTNPAPCLTSDGGILMAYRGNIVTAEGGFSGSAIGMAMAEAPGAPLRRLRDDPIVFGNITNRIEDPCLWWDGARYQMLAKDLTGALSGRFGDGVHAFSYDGRDWRLADEPRAWSRELTWADGDSDLLGSFERPQPVFGGGDPRTPSHLVCAMGDDSGANEWLGMRRSWCQVIPLHAQTTPPPTAQGGRA